MTTGTAPGCHAANAAAAATAPLPPVLFLAHGSPLAALADDAWSRALARCGQSLLGSFPRLRAVLIVSAHWQGHQGVGIGVGAAERPATIHDFGGFPPELSQLTYPAPGAPAVAQAVVAALHTHGLKAQLDAARGLDHGCWVPLRALLPAAQVPVVPVSLPPRLDLASLSALGTSLQELRASGCLVVGSGSITHNLRAISPQLAASHPDAWARDFDRAALAAVTANQPQLLLECSLPGAAMAVPTLEHLAPLVVAMAAHRPEERCVDLFSGFHHGNLSMRSLAFAAAGLPLAGAA